MAEQVGQPPAKSTVVVVVYILLSVDNSIVRCADFFYFYLHFLSGRDDKPADCIVFYGYQDIFRIATMVVMDHTGQQKMHNMVAYCQSVDKYDFLLSEYWRPLSHSLNELNV